MDIFTATMIAEGAEEATPQNQLRAWGTLIKTGVCWSLQGFFGRAADDLISNGIIDSDGEIDWDAAGLDPDEVYETPEPEPVHIVDVSEQMGKTYTITVALNGDPVAKFAAVGGYQQVIDSIRKQYGTFRQGGNFPVERNKEWIEVYHGERKYLVSPDGTWFSGDTDSRVAAILESNKHRGQRSRIHYGDAQTGKAWGDVETGYVGRSGGWRPCPLLVHNARSMGGEAILTHCIVKIEASRKVNGVYAPYYTHPLYQEAD